MLNYIRKKCVTKDGSNKYYYYKLLNNKKTRVSKKEYLTNNIFDIVITWVNWADKKFVKNLLKAGGRSEGCDSGEFIELKYLLRSLEKNDVNYNKIYIVHSDNHDPPKYLIKNNKNLIFIPHSNIVKNKDHLPLIHRESIVANLHNIPKLANNYFYLQDDSIINNNNIFDEYINNFRNKKIKTNRTSLYFNYDISKSCGLWYQSTINSHKIILKDKFIESNYKNSVYFEHTIKYFNKKIMNKIKKKYKNYFNNTSSYQDIIKHDYKKHDIICTPSLFENYLIYKLGFKELPNNDFTVIHSDYLDNVNHKNLLKFKNSLYNSLKIPYVVIQGNGISDEYPPCKKIRKIYLQFLEKTFPKCQFDVSNKFKKNLIGGYKIDNFNNVKKVLDINKKFYYDYNSSMGKTIDGMMSLDEHKVVLTYLQDVLNRGIKGDIVELGCYAGNTTIMMQKLLDLNNSNKKIYVYDSFEGFPETNNIEDNNQGGKGGLAFSLDNYILNIKNKKVKMPIINKGFFSDIPDNKYPSKICFVFYDGDLYQSTLDALNKVYNKVEKNGIILFDDFQHPNNIYPGVKKACLKYFNDDRVKFVGNCNLLGIKDDFFFVSSEKVSQGVYIKV